MVSFKFLCLLVVGVANKVCTLTDNAVLGECLKCCPDVVCPAAPPCPKVDCGFGEEEEAEVPEEPPWQGPVRYQTIAWISIFLTFAPLTVIFFVDKLNLPMFKKESLED